MAAGFGASETSGTKGGSVVMKVADIRPDDVMKGQEAAMQADIDWLVARRDSFVHVLCPACGTDDATVLYEKYGMRHVCCRSCCTQYADPRPDKQTLDEFYASSVNYAYWARHIFPASKESRREKLHRPRAELIKQLAAEHNLGKGGLLEVGAAYGVFCEEVRSTGIFSRVIGIEPTPDLAQICRDAGIEVIEDSYENVHLDMPVDIIASFEVIEHLFDPGTFLRWCHDMLHPGGFVFLTCPNIAGFEPLLLGKASGAVDHEHINLFTPESLRLLAGRSGFIDIEITTPGELDVELVQHALAEGLVSDANIGPVVKRFLERSDPGRLQALIQEAHLSSNMRMIARKPA